MMGVITEKSTLFIPFLMCSTLSILVRTACCIFALILCSFHFTADSFLSFLILICVALVQIYFFVVVNSSFLEMDEIVEDAHIEFEDTDINI